MKLLIASITMLVTADPSPVTVEIVSPLDGATVKGTIDLQINAASTVKPIKRIEVFRDGVLFKTIEIPQPPTNLRVEE